MKTTLADLQAEIQTVWAPLYTGRLRETLLLGQFINRDYDGEIKQAGDTVKVSQVVDPTAELRTVGVDADTFATQKASLQSISIVANKRAVMAYEFDDLATIQAKITDADFRDGMIYAIGKQINDFLYGLVAPSTSAPDNTMSGIASLQGDQLADVNVLASESRWPEDGNWYGLISPQYWGTIFKDPDLRSSLFVSDQPTVRGQSARSLMGFNCYKDNSRTGKLATFFHRNFAHLAMQRELSFQISSLHSQKKFGYIISADVIYGAVQGIDGAKKVITVTP